MSYAACLSRRIIHGNVGVKRQCVQAYGTCKTVDLDFVSVLF